MKSIPHSQSPPFLLQMRKKFGHQRRRCCLLSLSLGPLCSSRCVQARSRRDRPPPSQNEKVSRHRQRCKCCPKRERAPQPAGTSLREGASIICPALNIQREGLGSSLEAASVHPLAGLQDKEDLASWPESLQLSHHHVGSRWEGEVVVSAMTNPLLCPALLRKGEGGCGWWFLMLSCENGQTPSLLATVPREGGLKKSSRSRDSR